MGLRDNWREKLFKKIQEHYQPVKTEQIFPLSKFPTMRSFRARAVEAPCQSAQRAKVHVFERSHWLDASSLDISRTSRRREIFPRHHLFVFERGKRFPIYLLISIEILNK